MVKFSSSKGKSYCNEDQAVMSSSTQEYPNYKISYGLIFPHPRFFYVLFLPLKNFAHWL